MSTYTIRLQNESDRSDCSRFEQQIADDALRAHGLQIGLNEHLQSNIMPPSKAKAAIKQYSVPPGQVLVLECTFDESIAYDGMFAAWRYVRSAERFWYEFGYWSIDPEQPYPPRVEWRTSDAHTTNTRK